MKKVLILLFISCFTCLHPLIAQETAKSAVYDISLNAEDQISKAVKQADAEGKHIMLMIGGNWCKWCRMYDKFRTENAKVDSLSKASFVFVHINFSKENKNLPALESLGYPQRFGFPVFVVLNGKGERIHTQNSAYLEQGEGYSEEKVVEFYSQWAPAALDPAKYR